MTRIPAASIAHSDGRPAGYWYSADEQGAIDMTGDTASHAIETLLIECATAAEREAILAGSIEIL